MGDLVHRIDAFRGGAEARYTTSGLTLALEYGRPARPGEVHRHVNRLAQRLRDGWNREGARYGLEGCAYGTFSMVHTCLDRALLQAEGGPRYVKAKDARAGKLRRAMLVQGVDLMGSGGMLSLAHTDADVDRTIEAFGSALAALDHEGVL